MVPKVLELPFVPTAIEFLERELIDIVERNLNKMFPVKQGEAVLIVMYDASSKQELDSAVEAAAEAALANGALDCCIAGTPERAGAVWSVRGGILEGMKADSVAQEECDVVVPRARIAEYVKAAKKIASAHGIRVEPCGHCGDGNIHTEMLRGPEMSDQEWKEATHASLVELYALSKELGGQLSGEHGIGNGRLEFLEEFVGPRMIQLYKSIKLAFDDKLILNPGKAIANAAGSLLIPIFNQGKNRAQLRIAKAQQQEALNAFQQSILSAGSEVSNALYQYKAAGDKSASRKEQIHSLELSVNYTQQLLQLGTSTYLEVLTAQQSLLNAQLTQVSDDFQKMQAVVNLYQALGGGRDMSVKIGSKAAEKAVKAEGKKFRKEFRQNNK